MQYDNNNDAWKLRSLQVDYHTPVQEAVIANIYQVEQTMENRQYKDKSLAKRFMAGRGDDQPVNVTLELSAEDSQILETNHGCAVIIEEIIPEWFFISYDDLHTVDKFEVFEIELPAHFSKQFFFRYTVPLSKF